MYTQCSERMLTEDEWKALPVEEYVHPYYGLSYKRIEGNYVVVRNKKGGILARHPIS
jgi:hypothetical protein